MVIQHNMWAAFASRNLENNVNQNWKTVRKLSSGYRINTAADDAAGLTISEKMRWQIRGLKRASQNIQDGISLIQVADGALQEVHDMLQRMNELAVQGANDTNTDADRAAIQAEIDAIKKEINRISSDTEYNGIKVFKETEIPQVTGTPGDMLVYHEDLPGGGTQEGGIIYSGKRYAYDNMNLSYDENGNIVAGEYNVSVESDNGDMINITLIFDGGSRIPSGREYVIEPSEDGISIDGILYPWDEIKDTEGNAFDKDNIQTGTYSFVHAPNSVAGTKGITISFQTKDDEDLDSLIQRLQKDGLDNYSLQSSDVMTVITKINPTVSISNVNVTTAIQDYIPGSKTSNYTQYYMHADEDGICMYVPSQYNVAGTGDVYLTKMTWDELGLSEFKEGESVNPQGTAEKGETNKIYTYTDSDYTGISIKFTIDSEVSKGELINAINAWSISVYTNDNMNFDVTTGGNATISSNTHSSSLNTYGTQYDMGLPVDSNYTLLNSTKVTNNAGQLSFVMTDANGTDYTFSSSTISQSTLRTNAMTALTNYIESYRKSYENRLNGKSSSSVSSTWTNTVTFNSDIGSYYLSLGYRENLSSYLPLSDSDFTATQNATTGVWTVTSNISPSTTLANSLGDDMYNSIINTSVGITSTTTDNTGKTVASNSITSTTTTTNKRYSSQVISDDREVKIQAGAKEGQWIAIKLPAMNTGVLKIGNVDVSDYDSASASLSKIQSAIDRISEIRSGYGATQNRLEHAKAIDDITAENTQAAESRIRDADMAEESVAYAIHNILIQSGQSVLAQANNSLKDLVEQLLK